MLLPETRGKTAPGRGLEFKLYETLSRAIPSRSDRGFFEEEKASPQIKITTTSDSLTRQLFLSSSCSRFASIIAVVTGVNPSQPAIAMDSNNFDTSTTDQNLSCSPTSARVLSMTLRSLPVSGCWAATVTVSKTLDNDGVETSDDDDFYTYLAVVDTGSPFLTAPAGAYPQTQKLGTTTITKTQKKIKEALFTNSSTRFRNGSIMKDDISYEQYGTTIGSIRWRNAPYLTLIGTGDVENIRSKYESSLSNPKLSAGGRRRNAEDDSSILETEIEPVVIQDETDIVLGIPSDEVVEETGGIFLGLMTIDAARPTPLHQLGYDAFAMRFREEVDIRPNDGIISNKKKNEVTKSDGPATLLLWDGKQSNTRCKSKAVMNVPLIDPFDPYAMKLFDLTPYGPNIHHYGVLCDRFECRWGGNEAIDTVAFACNIESGINVCTSACKSVSLSRPLVAVFDTGLSGCIFSDTLWDEIQSERRRQQHDWINLQDRRDEDMFDNTKDKNQSNKRKNALVADESYSEEAPIACTVRLPTFGNNARYSSKAHSSRPSAVSLSSNSKYWRFQSFRLPWWYADNVRAEDDDSSSKITKNFPHVVVLGSTFWRNPNVLELAIDTTSKRAKIVTVTKG